LQHPLFFRKVQIHPLTPKRFPSRFSGTGPFLRRYWETSGIPEQGTITIPAVPSMLLAKAKFGGFFFISGRNRSFNDTGKSPFPSFSPAIRP
jgi:hypothetical protein